MAQVTDPESFERLADWFQEHRLVFGYEAKLVVTEMIDAAVVYEDHEVRMSILTVLELKDWMIDTGKWPY